MKTIEHHDLANVCGGFLGLLAPLLSAAPGILQGVSGIISASKSKGGAPQQAAPQQAAPQQAAPQGEAAAAATSAATGGLSPRPRVSVSVGSF